MVRKDNIKDKVNRLREMEMDQPLRRLSMYRSVKRQSLSQDYHIGIFGAGRVGKTSIIKRRLSGEYLEEYQPTVCELYQTVWKGQERDSANLILYDTAGSMSFPAMNRITIAKCMAFIVVFSLDSVESLNVAERYLQDIRNVKGDIRSPCVVVGNKSDVSTSQRKVTFEQGVRFSVKYTCSYMEMSAKAGVNINELFDTVVKKIKHFEALEKEQRKRLNKHLASRRTVSLKSLLF